MFVGHLSICTYFWDEQLWLNVGIILHIVCPGVLHVMSESLCAFDLFKMNFSSVSVFHHAFVAEQQ